MAAEAGFKHLIEQLPRERLSASMSAQLATALAGGDAAAVLAAGRDAVAELLREGVLVKVALAGHGSSRQALYLVRDTSRLLDLTLLQPTPAVRPSPPPTGGRQEARPDSQPAAGTRTPASPADRPAATAEAGPVLPHQAAGPTAWELPLRGPDRLHGLLDAMERAQDLAVGDPRASEPAVLVDGILELIHGYAPEIQLYAQLFTGVLPLEARHLVPLPDRQSMPFWLQQRRPGQALWLPHAVELPSMLQGQLARDATRPPVTAVVPLRSPIDPQVEVGLFYVLGSSDWPSGELLQLAQRLAAFVTRRWRCQDDVNRRVLMDSLTGIHNRAFFDSQFPLEVERASRAHLPLTVVITDLDCFKRINDTHGHQCGDVVLRAVAQQLQSRLRRIDHVCRIGGEEFGCLLPSTSVDEARDVLTRVVAQAYRVTLPPEFGVGHLEVTMSYGAVTFPDAGQSPSELHRKADNMLYQAKELGRNRCCLWTADGHCQQLLPA